MKTTRDLWAQYCTELAIHESNNLKASVLSFKRLCWEFPPIDDSIKLTTVGYNPNSNKKFTSLCHHYENHASLAYAKDYLAKNFDKKEWQVGISLQGERKTFSKQDYCMQSMVITKNRGVIYIDCMHRNTELIKKFAADLVFIKYLLDKLGITEYESIHFFFSNANLNAIFYPILIPYQEDWQNSFQQIRSNNLRYYKNIVRWSYRHIQDEEASYRFIRRVQQSLPRIMSPKLLKQFKSTINKEQIHAN